MHSPPVGGMVVQFRAVASQQVGSSDWGLPVSVWVFEHSHAYRCECVCELLYDSAVSPVTSWHLSLKKDETYKLTQLQVDLTKLKLLCWAFKISKILYLMIQLRG